VYRKEGNKTEMEKGRKEKREGSEKGIKESKGGKERGQEKTGRERGNQ
jgi:hypothetical protein